MQLHELVNTIGQDLQRRYGEKVHKLTLHGGFSCPNRDGTIGRGGCTFCNVASFADEEAQVKSIHDQLIDRAGEIDRAKKYLAYFQAYTSTYAEVQVLKNMYEEALKAADIVGLCVGTRPDCVPDAVLDLLSDYVKQGYEIWLELGLQTANNDTLKRINRGHDFECYAEITKRARAHQSFSWWSYVFEFLTHQPPKFQCGSLGHDIKSFSQVIGGHAGQVQGGTDAQASKFGAPA